jgi:proline iminopeptidase
MDLEGGLITWPSITRHFEEGTLEKGLTQLLMPALVVHGDASPVPPVEAERTAALIPGATLRILPGVGHFPWIEEPGSIRRELEGFLAANPSVR